MTDYVALLRGVNVGGVNIRMAELAEAVSGLGFERVRTVLASGNVLFASEGTAAEATTLLEDALRARFGYEAWVHVLPMESLRAIVAAYPFERGREGWHDYVSVVVDPDTRSELLAVGSALDPDHESAAAGDGVLYWTVERGHTLDSAMGRAQSKAKHKRWLTTRNINTLDKLIA